MKTQIDRKYIICGEICESRPFRTQKQKLWHMSSAIPEKSQDW